ncbi:glycoside hydrolase family 43 protein [Maribellus sediminis]|uniref:glycoside hydrolase family 43 protein n=1 Tax=Maribellus sediminis TaxID=2696285 RepID=UPI00143015CC|nr:glycoside hydrolase family 43 protein [Maribellus sediminis]
MKNLLLTLFSVLIFLPAIAQNQKSFQPGELWPDNKGIHINAHGGGIMFYEGKYYWFGEHKIEGKMGNRAMVGVHCYSSGDLLNWTEEGIALEVDKDNPDSDITQGCILERPKVIYNAKTGKFVMWFHLELKGMGYAAARTGLAVADKVTGPFTFVRSLNPNAGEWPLNFADELKGKNWPDDLKPWSDEWVQAVKDGMLLKRDFQKGQMARDMTLYVDKDGKAYHIHASEENLTLHISELTDDYLGFTGNYIRVQPTGHNEAPSIFEYNGKYYMITSGCTGWAPNAARLLVSDSVMGEWEYVNNPCVGEDRDLTFHSQSTYILPVEGKTDAFIFMADRWQPQNPIDGRYIWLPIQFDDKGLPVLEWMDSWSMEIFDR